jgi:predicted glycosyltransferases
VFRAYRDFLRWHRDLSRKRKTIRQNRKGSAEEKIYRGSVVLRYLLGRRTFGRMM